MRPTVWDYTFHLYILPEDLIKVKQSLEAENLHYHCYAYDVGSVGVSIGWVISETKHPSQFHPFNQEVESSGLMKGFYCLKFSWSGPEDASPLADFKKKYDFGMHLLGYSGDWLGYPICLFFSQETKEKCKQIVLEERKLR